tara:strand:+ start:188 stop:790 length:603 start_codon:yes stop_codon:yes gene_type:complete
MALAYSNITVELREISLKDRPPELYEVSKKGTVPVLITKDNIVIDESLEIMLWALKNNISQTWLSENYKSKELEKINFNDTVFKKWLDGYKYHDRHPENSKEYYRKKCHDILFEYDMQLSKTKYMISDVINLVDIALFPFIRQFANVDYVWFEESFVNIDLWLRKIVNSNLFIAVMDKYKVWSKTDEKLIVNFNAIKNQV